MSNDKFDPLPDPLKSIGEGDQVYIAYPVGVHPYSEFDILPGIQFTLHTVSERSFTTFKVEGRDDIYHCNSAPFGVTKLQAATKLKSSLERDISKLERKLRNKRRALQSVETYIEEEKDRWQYQRDRRQCPKE